jgi:hypothetical protein
MMIAQLAGSSTFRERSAVVLLIREIYQKSQNEEDKELLKAELEKFTNKNEVPNVI